jgi:ribosome maturation factor RimP
LGGGRWPPFFFTVKMDRTKELKRRLISDGDRLFSELGCYVVAVEIESSRSAPLARFFIDTTSGESVNVGLCGRAARIIREHLETTGMLGEEFGLEVSSPGLDRRVARPRDFRRFTGQRIRFRVADPIEGRRKFEGTIVTADDAAVVIDTGEKELTLPYARLARANLIYDFSRAEER